MVGCEIRVLISKYFCGPRSLLSSGYQGLFRWGWIGRGVKLTAYLHLVTKSKVH